jgi:hypothetical protein
MNARISSFPAVILVFCLLTQGVYAKVSLPGLFSNHMVVQRDQPVPVWGTAAESEETGDQAMKNAPEYLKTQGRPSFI